MTAPVFVPHAEHDDEVQRRLSLAYHRLGTASDRLGDGDVEAADLEVFAVVYLLLDVLPADLAAAACVNVIHPRERSTVRNGGES